MESDATSSIGHTAIQTKNDDFSITEDQPCDEWKNSVTCALLNDVILRKLFSFLSLQDFKQSRLVCRKWEEVGEAAFKKRVRICFDFDKKPHREPSTYEEIVALLKETLKLTSCSSNSSTPDLTQFFNESTENISFTAVRLSGRLPWTPSQLIEFFANAGKMIADLELNCVSLPVYEHDDEFHKSYNLTTLVGGLKNLRCLNVKGKDVADNEATRFMMPLDDKSDLRVYNCKFKCFRTFPVNDETKIVPFYNSQFLQLKGDSIQLWSLHFRRFNNLVELKLLSLNCSKIVKIDVNLIPKSVRKVYLGRNDFQFIGSGVFSLDTLILQYSTLELVNKATQSFSPKNLTVYCNEILPRSDNYEIMTLLRKGFPCVLIGPFDWTSHFYFSEYFDMENLSVFYSFVNGKGKAITLNTFLKMMNTDSQSKNYLRHLISSDVEYLVSKYERDDFRTVDLYY